MFKYNKEIGNYGESLSYNYLQNAGHIILDKNYRNMIGEIDIISKFNELIIFTEVKSRYTNSYGYPLEAVTYSKQLKIKKISSLYVLINNLANYNVRFDVIEVLFNNENNNYTLNHIQDAFR